MSSRSYKKYQLVVKGSLVVGIVIVLKLIAHWFGWEIISLNPLLSGIVAANVFLMGFLLSGILTDYKESERLPGELTTSIESIVEEAVTIYKSKNVPVAKECFTYLHQFTVSMKNWFYKKERTKDVMEKLSGLSDFFVAFEPLTQATFKPLSHGWNRNKPTSDVYWFVSIQSRNLFCVIWIFDCGNNHGSSYPWAYFFQNRAIL